MVLVPSASAAMAQSRSVSDLLPGSAVSKSKEPVAPGLEIEEWRTGNARGVPICRETRNVPINPGWADPRHR